jgi:four helix bundle protein
MTKDSNNPECLKPGTARQALKPGTSSSVKRFEDLVIFQMARDLCKEVYAITKDGEFHKDSRFVQQIHASAGSVMDNIAEGFERDGNKEFINFLYIAKGSCGEVRSQIIRAADVSFIDKKTATRLYNDCFNLSKAIAHFIKSLRTSGLSGLKYQAPSSKN